MKLTLKSFSKIVQILMGCYPRWNIGQDGSVFRDNMQEVVPEELAMEMLRVYRTRRAKGPESAVDFLNAYIEYQIENAHSIGEVIDEITAGIKQYDAEISYDFSFSDCDEYLMQIVIPALPCSGGVKSFYHRNKEYLFRLAREAPESEERKSIYKKLEYDYREQLIITERNAIIKKINNNVLPNGYNPNRLES